MQNKAILGDFLVQWAYIEHTNARTHFTVGIGLFKDDWKHDQNAFTKLQAPIQTDKIVQGASWNTNKLSNL